MNRFTVAMSEERIKYVLLEYDVRGVIGGVLVHGVFGTEDAAHREAGELGLAKKGYGIAQALDYASAVSTPTEAPVDPAELARLVAEQVKTLRERP